jgi:hypothetical protein
MEQSWKDRRARLGSSTQPHEPREFHRDRYLRSRSGIDTDGYHAASLENETWVRDLAADSKAKFVRGAETGWCRRGLVKFQNSKRHCCLNLGQGHGVL